MSVCIFFVGQNAKYDHEILIITPILAHTLVIWYKDGKEISYLSNSFWYQCRIVFHLAKFCILLILNVLGIFVEIIY